MIKKKSDISQPFSPIHNKKVKFQGMLPYISYIGTDFLRGAKGYKSLPYTPYGLKLGVEFNLIGYESGEDFVLFLIQDLI